jgi:hypothetical protein
MQPCAASRNQFGHDPRTMSCREAFDGYPDKRTADLDEARRPEVLAAQTEFLDQRLVAAFLARLQIVEQTAALRNESE